MTRALTRVGFSAYAVRLGRTENYRASASRQVCNGPQPRSWVKPGRDAKSVVPGLRPGGRRARRRWPAAAGMFWRRELVTCETVAGVVINFSRENDLRVGGPPVGGPATPVEFCHSACEMGRSPKLGRIPSTGTRVADHSEDWQRPVPGDGRVGFGVARGVAVVCERTSVAGFNADDQAAHKFTKSRVSQHATGVWARSGTPDPKDMAVAARSGTAKIKKRPSPCVAVRRESKIRA